MSEFKANAQLAAHQVMIRWNIDGEWN